MQGLPTIGTIGFGWFEVSGRSRVPSPPAITTAFTASPHADLPSGLHNVLRRSDERPARGAIQKSQSGHSVSWPTTIRKPSERVEQPRRRLAELADRELVAVRHEQPVARRAGSRHARR